VSLVEAKAYLRIGHDGEDDLVTSLAQSARARLEQAAGLALVTRTLSKSVRVWPQGIRVRGITMRPGPVQRLVSVTLVAADGSQEDLSDNFQLEAGRICLKATRFLPIITPGGHIKITFEAGYGAAGDVPEDLQLAVKLLIADAYRRRESDGSLAQGVSDILTARREVRL